MSKMFKKQIFDFMSLTANTADEGDLWVYGDIVNDKWWDDDVSPRSIRDALDEMGSVKTLNLRINSYGGSCFAGNTIVNLIDNYKKKNGSTVNAYIDGIAASMGSGIAMAADHIYMAENAIFMVHKPYSIALGNSDDMLHEAEVLEKVEDTLVANYMRHFNGTEDELRQLMADESWLTADEALEYGFCDEIVEAVQIAASAKGLRINGKDFRDEKLKEKFKETNSGGDKVFEYDKKLNNYGISKDIFDSWNIDAETVCSILESAVIQPVEGEIAFMTSDHVKNALGKEMSADDVLVFAKAGMEVDHEADAKAKAYDKLVNSAIEDAIKSGTKAKGDSFNETKWKKILNGLEYEEIIDQKNEWEAEAKLALKAGRRASIPWEQKGNAENFHVNPDDFKL